MDSQEQVWDIILFLGGSKETFLLSCSDRQMPEMQKNYLVSVPSAPPHGTARPHKESPCGWAVVRVVPWFPDKEWDEEITQVGKQEEKGKYLERT